MQSLAGVLVVVLGWVLVGGCDSGVTTNPPLTVESWHTGFVYQPVNRPYVFTLKITLPDGSPATDTSTYDVVWPQHFDPGVTQIDANPSPGVYTSTITSSYGTRILESSVNVMAYVDSDHINTTSQVQPSVKLQFWGGTADKIFALDKTVNQLVGEVRPFTALATSPSVLNGVKGNPVLADTAVTYAIANPAIATIDARGWVTGVSVGTTTLTASAGSLHVDVPVAITAGTPAPPPDGPTRIDGSSGPPAPHDTGTISVGSNSPPGSRGLAIDSRGYPMAVVGSYLPFVELLAEWTGSGYGIELVQPPEATGQGQISPVIAIDDREHVYMAWTDGRIPALFIADRASPAAAWRIRTLDASLPEFAGTDSIATAYFVSPGLGISLLPKPGGGVFAAAWTEYDERLAPEFMPPTLDCLGALRLWTVSDNAITSSNVDRVAYEPDFITQCQPPTGIAVGSLFPESPGVQLLPAEGSETLPRIVSMMPLLFGDGPKRYVSTGTTWTGATISPPKFVSPTTGETFDLRWMATATPVVAGERSQIVLGMMSPPPFGNRLWKVLESDLSIRTAAAALVPNADDPPFALRGPGVLYLDSGGPIARTRDFIAHDPLLDDPQPALRLGPMGARIGRAITTASRRYELAVGETVNNEQAIVLAIEPLLGHTATPTDPDTVGTRIDYNSPIVPRDIDGPPAILPDGSRYLMTHAMDQPELIGDDPMGVQINGAVLRSAAPGQPFTGRAVRRARLIGDISGELSWVKVLYGTTTGLYGIVEYDNRKVRIVRSTDAGLTFTEIAQIAPTASPTSIAVTGKLITRTGALWVAMQEGVSSAMFFSPDLSSVAPTQLPGVLTNSLNFATAGFVEQPNGNVLFAALVQVSSQWRMLLRHYSAAGVQLDEAIVDPQASDITPDWEIHFDVSAALPDGTVLIDESKYTTDPVLGSGTGYQHRMIRVSGLAITLGTPLNLPGLDGWSQASNMVQLADGRVAFGASRQTTAIRAGAFYVTSADGTTWSTPRELRPTGGHGQLLVGLAVEPGGSLCALVYDNAALNDAMGAGYDFRGEKISGPNVVPPEPVFMEIPTP